MPASALECGAAGHAPKGARSAALAGGERAVLGAGILFARCLRVAGCRLITSALLLVPPLPLGVASPSLAELRGDEALELHHELHHVVLATVKFEEALRRRHVQLSGVRVHHGHNVIHKREIEARRRTRALRRRLVQRLATGLVVTAGVAPDPQQKRRRALLQHLLDHTQAHTVYVVKHLRTRQPFLCWSALRRAPEARIRSRLRARAATNAHTHLPPF